MSNFEYIVSVVTVVNTLFLAYIAWKQHGLEKQKSTLEQKQYISDNFEKRFEIFKGVQSFLSVILREAAIKGNELADFTVYLQQSYFLFDDEIYNYLKEIRKRAIEFDSTNKRMAAQSEKENRTDIVNRNAELLGLLTDELQEGRANLEISG